MPDSNSFSQICAVTEDLDVHTPDEKAICSPASRWQVCLFNSVSFPVVLALIVITVIFALSRQGLPDPDIWWHLHNADYLVQHHSLPRSDMYSFTVSGHPWINHEWIGELPYYFAWRMLGVAGINGVMFITLTLIFLGVLYLCYRESEHYKASIVAACFAVLLGSVSFGPRTILFGYAYLVILLNILQRFRQKGRGALWIVPLLFCLWVNTHGSWLLGLIVFSTVIAAGFVKGEWGLVTAEAWTGAQKKSLLRAWAMSIAALFVNPFGPRLVFYPLDLAFRQKLNIEHVAEWISINFHDTRGKLAMALLLVLLISALLRPRRWTLAEVALGTFTLYSGLTYSRFLFFLGIVIAPVLAKIFTFVPPYRRSADTPVVNAVVMALMVAGVIHYWPRQPRLQELVAEQYPVGAVSYLQAHPATGPMLNFYLWGGYLNWRDSQTKVFIDSRVDIFEYSGVLKDYLDMIALNQPEALLNKYGIRYVLFPHGEPLTYVLQRDPNWKVLYSDQISVLLERSGQHQPQVTANIQANTPANAAQPDHEGF